MSIGYYPLLFNLTKELSKDMDITVFSGGWPKRPMKERIENIEIIRTPTINTKIGRMEYISMCSHIRRMNNYDIINGFGNDASVLFRLAGLLKKNNTRITSSMSIMRGWYEAMPKKFTTNNRYLKTIEYYDTLSVKNSDNIITLSNYAKDEITRNYGTEPEKIKVIYPGIDTKKFNKVKIDNNPYEGKKVLFFAGGLSARKGLDILLDAFIELKKDHKNLIILVAGTDSLNEHSLKLEKNNIKTGEDIILLGNVRHEDMPYYFSLSDIYIHPSYHETFGIVLIESLACKTPVITTDATAMPEAIGDCGLLISPGSSKDLEQKIRTLIEDEKLLRSISNRSRTRVIDKFTIERCVKDYKEYYNSFN